MSKLTLKAFLALFFLGGFVSVNAQDGPTDNHDVNITIPSVAILDIEPSGSTSIDLVAEAPTEAGDSLSFANAEDETLWLNYSSIVASGATRKVSVKVDAIPSGLVLKVTAADYAGSGGAGTTGTANANALTLSTSDQDIVTGIGSCYTGDGNTNGHKLSYALSADKANYGNIVTQTDNAVTVTYTISE